VLFGPLCLSGSKGNRPLFDFDLSFSVPEKERYVARGSLKSGEIVALMGPSGCGKTTFLRALMGFHPAHSKVLSLDGLDLREVELSKRGFGVSFQGGALLPHLTAFENVLLPLKYSLVAKGRSREWLSDFVLESMSKVGLKECRNSLPQNLSGGEKQRVAVLRAILPRPKVVFLDEPTAGIDAEQKRALLDWISECLREVGASTIVVTRDPWVAEAFATRSVNWPTGRHREIVF